jgi:hypothetical protein
VPWPFATKELLQLAAVNPEAARRQQQEEMELAGAAGGAFLFCSWMDNARFACLR